MKILDKFSTPLKKLDKFCTFMKFLHFYFLITMNSFKVICFLVLQVFFLLHFFFLATILLWQTMCVLIRSVKTVVKLTNILRTQIEKEKGTIVCLIFYLRGKPVNPSLFLFRYYILIRFIILNLLLGNKAIN